MSIVQERKGRNAFRVAIAYLTGAWLLVEVPETLFLIDGFSDAAVRRVVTLQAILVGIKGFDQNRCEGIKKRTLAAVRGIVQADILKEDHVQNTCIFGTEIVQTALYCIVAEHWPRFVLGIERSDGHLPGFVRQEFEDYLKCGLLQHGSLRVESDGCRQEHLVAFSCKRRGFCPGCGARRSIESAAQPEALTWVLAVVQRGISTFVVQHSGLSVSSGARTWAVTLTASFCSRVPYLAELRTNLP